MLLIRSSRNTLGNKSVLTVLGELDELSRSSGESSSSSGSVGMAGGSEGRDRVCGKTKRLSAAEGASGGFLGLRSLPWVDFWGECSLFSWNCRGRNHVRVEQTHTHIHARLWCVALNEKRCAERKRFAVTITKTTITMFRSLYSHILHSLRTKWSATGPNRLSHPKHQVHQNLSFKEL